MKNEPDGWQLLQDSYQSQIQSLQHEMTEYESLITYDTERRVVLPIDDINKISDILIKARIALKITQKELAALCDRTEDQIQAYEDKNYGNASLIDFLLVSQICAIAESHIQF